MNEEKALWLKDPIWYAPTSVIHHWATHIDTVPIEQRGTKAYRKAHELLVAALALLGIQYDESQLYWMQLVADSEGTPDVRTGHFVPQTDGGAPHFNYQDVELVEFFPHIGEEIAPFLLRTKLSPGKAYDERTTILCHIPKAAHIPSWPAITQALRGCGAKCPVVVIGCTNVDPKEYTLVQVYPQLKNIADFNLGEIIKTQPRRSVLNMTRGSKPSNVSHPFEKHCPFESAGFACPIIEQESAN